jgi:2-methylisocitrate lyase-like PEP mutase family enzyme
MRRRHTIQQALALEKPLITPAAHDALTARMIDRAGFQAMAIGGSSMLAARYGLPDLGLAALGEMLEGARDIIGATDLPLIMDGDDGYGDVKSVVRMIHAYEDLGVGAVVLEDQVRDVKQPGNAQARSVAPVGDVCTKLRAAAAARRDPTLLIVARSDSHGLEGIDGALRRCEQYLKAGADGVFVPGVRSAEDLARIGATFRGTYQMVDMVEGKPPWLHPHELHAMGFSQVVYPAHVILRATLALDRALSELRGFAAGSAELAMLADPAAARTMFREAVREREWAGYEQLGKST